MQLHMYSLYQATKEKASVSSKSRRSSFTPFSYVESTCTYKYKQKRPRGALLFSTRVDLVPLRIDQLVLQQTTTGASIRASGSSFKVIDPCRDNKHGPGMELNRADSLNTV